MESKQSPLRLLLADDHIVVRQGIRTLLEDEGFIVVAEASDGHSAVRLCNLVQPDVAILDLAMPSLNGIDAARGILKLHRTTRIVLLTMYAEESFVLASLRAGITGYVLKSGAGSTLVQAIEAVWQNDTYLSPGVSPAVVQTYLSNAPTPRALSVQQCAVLQLIAEGRNMKEIGGMLGISAKTAETHRSRIMAKLDIHEVAGLVRYAVANGLIIVERSCTVEDVANRAAPVCRLPRAGGNKANPKPDD